MALNCESINIARSAGDHMTAEVAAFFRCSFKFEIGLTNSITNGLKKKPFESSQVRSIEGHSISRIGLAGFEPTTS
jgi:hypothetical protein